MARRSQERHGALKTQGAVQPARRARFQADNQHLVRCRDERLARKRGRPDAIGGAANGRVQIKLVTIVLCAGVAVEGDPQLAQRLVALRERALQLFGSFIAREVVLLLENQPAHFCERARLGRRVALGGVPRPQRVFVEVDSFALHAARHHGAQPPVAERQRIGPARSRMPVPNLQLGRGGRAGGRRKRLEGRRQRRNRSKKIASPHKFTATRRGGRGRRH